MTLETPKLQGQEEITDHSDDDVSNLPNFVLSPVGMQEVLLESGDSIPTTRVDMLNRRDSLKETKGHSSTSSLSESPSWDQDDNDPGTSTEEAYLDELAEQERSIAKRRRQRLKERRESHQDESYASMMKNTVQEFIQGNGFPEVGPDDYRFSKWGMLSFSKRESIWSRILRWPILLIIFLIIGIEALLYAIVRFVVVFYEQCIVWQGKSKPLRRKMDKATTYQEWRGAAIKMDSYLGNEEWKKIETSDDYDAEVVSRMTRRLRKALDKNDAYKIKELLLHGGIKPNLGGVENVALYSSTYYGSKDVVEDYVQTVIEAIDFIGNGAQGLLNIQERRQFLKAAAKSYGRSALCLSGGASFGYYHLGVVKALLEADLLPSVFTGTSAGSLMAAMICVRTDDEIRRDILKPEIYTWLTACSDAWPTRVARFVKQGSIFDRNDWYQKMGKVTGNYTFLEAYKRTGKILNVSVIPEEPGAPPKLLNYVTAPDVVIASAVLASSAVPGVLGPVELILKTAKGKLVPFRGSGKRWRDGSLRVDIPDDTLHRLYNVNYTIVSQVNPHVAIWFYNRRGAPGAPTSHRGGRGWRGGFLLSMAEQLLKLELIKWTQLLDLLSLSPRWFGHDPPKFFLQNFEGSITLVPNVTFMNYVHILTDPSRETMIKYMHGGQEATWPALHAIENRQRIEQAITNARRKTVREMKRLEKATRQGELLEVPSNKSLGQDDLSESEISDDNSSNWSGYD